MRLKGQKISLIKKDSLMNDGYEMRIKSFFPFSIKFQSMHEIFLRKSVPFSLRFVVEE